MNTLRLTLVIGLAIIMMGCPTRSFHSLFTENDSEFRPELIGAWVNVGNPTEEIRFEQSGTKGYSMIVAEENGESVSYNALIGQIGGFWFLDSSPKRGGEDFHFIPVHIFSRLWLNGDTLRIASLEGDWLGDMIDQNKLSITHVRRDREVILTATTEELRSLVLRFVQDPGAFPDPNVMIRKK